MPEVLSGCVFGSGRLKVDDATSLLRRHLLGKSDGQVEAYATHSAKATLLSWLAKAGVNENTRRMLGYHAVAGDRSMLENSRDAVTDPMREVCRVLGLIRAKTFNPDVTRSGRWAGEVADAPAAAPELSDSTSSSSSSDGETNHYENEAADVAADTLDRDLDLVLVPPPEGLVSNPATRLQHRAGHEQSVTACGHRFTLVGYKEHVDWIPGWGKCRSAKCFPT